MDPTTDDEPQQGSRRGLVLVAIGAIILVVVVVMALAVLVALRASDGGAEAQQATTVDTATLPQTVPFRSVAGHVVVDADIEGADLALGFMLDSGAPVLYAAEVAAEHGGDVLGGVKTQAVDGSIQTLDVVSVDRLSLGGADFLDVAGPVGWVDDGNPLMCVTDNGLLGANLMKNAVWQIDYQAEEVAMAPSVAGLDHIEGAVTFDFNASTSSPSPVLELPVGNGNVTFLLDTGSDGALSVHPADLEAVGLTVDDSSPRLFILGAGAAGTFSTELAYVHAPLGLGTDALMSYPIAATETLAQGQGNMGNLFLREFVVTIDWPEMTVYLDPVAEDGSVGRPAAPAVAGVSWDGEGLVVGSLLKGGAAEVAGLELGTPVISIDGTDYSSATFDDFCDLLTAPAAPAATGSTSSTLTTDDGQTHSIEAAEGFFD